MLGPVFQPDDPAPDAARQVVLSAAAGHGWREIDRAWIDKAALSETDLRLPGVEGAIEGLGRRRDRALVIAKLGPTSASLRDVALLMGAVTRGHWALVALEVDLRTAHGRVAIATFAPYERRFLAERTRAALAAKRAAGLHVGRKRAVPDEIVQRIVSERQAGASLHHIANGLNADGIRGSGRGRWHASTVRHILLSVERDARLT